MQTKISLIIPVKNEESSIGELLSSVMSQTLVPEEIVITDGGSRDNTPAVIESYVQKGVPIKLIKAPEAFPGKGRNLAIEYSHNGLIAMTDAGIILCKDWLKELLRPFEADPSVSVVYGSYEPIIDSLFKECFVLLTLSAPSLLNGRWTRTNSVASLMLKKEVWERLGGFPDLRAAEDKIFMERIKKGKFKTAVNPAAAVYWKIPGDFKTVFKKTSLYSMHDLIAGRFKDWHRSVTIIYCAGIIVAAMGLIFTPAWFLLLPIGIIVRAGRILFKKSPDKKISYFFDVRRQALLIALMLWIDVAMFWGMARYVFKRR